MPELLLELFSEEIPARMQPGARDELAQRLGGLLLEKQLRDFERLDTFATPRRLTAVVRGLPERQPDLTEERRGPRADAPERAIAGFKASLPQDAKLEERTEKKGTFLYATITREGRDTAAVLAESIPQMIRQFSWPKSMRTATLDFRWVRPLQGVLCVFAGNIVDFEIDGIRSGETTRGHRFLSGAAFKAADFADYECKLRAAHVLLDATERETRIAQGAAELAAAEGLKVIPDPALLAENAGLTEWPVPLIGRFDEAFLEVPPEVLTTSMKTHQKFFSLRDPATGKLAPRFICVANTEARDGGKAIAAGNERVLAARLSDARFFWQQDLKTPLEQRVDDLKDIVFHEQLGTLYERVERIEALAAHIAETVDLSHLPFSQTETVAPTLSSVTPAKAGAHGAAASSRKGQAPEPAAAVDSRLHGNDGEGLVQRVRRAARLAKADLTTGMVGEFPELQGLMGRYYALEQGEPAAVARAVEEHYAPRGPDDACPSDPVSVCVALAEKLDTLVGFFAIGQKPTGSKDPYALRRAALGAIRLVVENRLRVRLLPLLDAVLRYRPRGTSRLAGKQQPKGFKEEHDTVSIDLLDFFADRLKVQQREKGVRHDYIEAVFLLGGEDDLVRLLDRVAALQDFLATDDGANLLAGYKRANNILKIEEKKDAASYGDKDVDSKLLKEPAEATLYEKLGAAQGEAERALELEDFADAMRALASLRAPIDAFFDHVTVNAEDAALRANRLALLGRIRAAVDTVADFSKIEG